MWTGDEAGGALFTAVMPTTATATNNPRVVDTKEPQRDAAITQSSQIPEDDVEDLVVEPTTATTTSAPQQPPIRGWR